MRLRPIPQLDDHDRQEQAKRRADRGAVIVTRRASARKVDHHGSPTSSMPDSAPSDSSAVWVVTRPEPPVPGHLAGIFATGRGVPRSVRPTLSVMVIAARAVLPRGDESRQLL